MSENKKPSNKETMEKIEKNTELINDEIMKLKEENSDLKDKWQRALADYQNLERRTQTEISQRVSEKTTNLLLNFLNIYEDFIRAENSLSKEKINTDGIQAVLKNMETIYAHK